MSCIEINENNKRRYLVDEYQEFYFHMESTQSFLLQTTSGAHVWSTIQVVAACLATAHSHLKFESLRTPPEATELSSPLKMSANSIKFVRKWKKHAILYT